MTTTFQDRIEAAILLAGSQRQLARMVSELLGKKVSQQSIHKLANRNAAKPAKSSSLTVAIAQAVGLNPVWMAMGTGPKTLDASPGDNTIELLRKAEERLAMGNISDDSRQLLEGALRMVINQPVAPYKLEKKR